MHEEKTESFSSFARMVEALSVMNEGLKKLGPPPSPTSGMDAVIVEIEHQQQSEKFTDRLWLTLQKRR